VKNSEPEKVRRVVTGHNEKGQAVFISDQQFQPENIPSGDAAFSLLWTSPVLPADNNDNTDGRERDAGLTLKQGSVIRIVDMLPGGESPMHRTNSLDYGIVLSGSVELEMDDNTTTVLNAGDICVQPAPFISGVPWGTNPAVLFSYSQKPCLISTRASLFRRWMFSNELYLCPWQYLPHAYAFWPAHGTTAGA